MNLRTVFAALTVAVIGAVCFAPVPGQAQMDTPENSAKAKAAFQPPSDSTVAGAMPAPAADGKTGKATVERTAADPSGGKAALAKPSEAMSSR